MLKEADFGAYTFEKHQRVEELNGEGYVLRHKKSGARVLVIENEDRNKVFSIAFRTTPKDDTGVAHIMEHSVLCGSEKFPSKDPFVELVKGSMNTFLNAMTYSDKTVYPIASCNEKDYHNLMHVYLDAVFHPNIYSKPEIMQQEGWHYEIDEKSGELKFNGVVYNEMKGVFSDPEAILERKIQGALLPDTTYGFESGGDPDAIPQLTREKFLEFHQTYYHPCNSYIYLYGDVDFEKELTFLDEEYLSHYDKIAVNSEISMQKPFASPVVCTDTYPVSEEEEDDGIYLSYNVAVGNSCDGKLSLAIQILDYVLFSMPGAPVKKKLIEAGIGKDIDSSYNDVIQQPLFSVIAKGVAPDQEQKFVREVDRILRETAQRGINRKAILSCINNLEFKYREGNFGRYPKGLIYGLNFLNSWLYDDEKALEMANVLETLAELKKEAETGYFERLLQTYFVDNLHRAYVNLYPEAGKNERMEQQLKEQLARVKASLDRKQIYYLEQQTEKLKNFQTTPSSQEDLLKIPLLELSDITREVRPFRNVEKEIGGLPTVIHDYPTNEILYLDFCFDMTELPEELMPYTTMLVDLFRYVDTANYTYNELATELNLKVGGMSFSTGICTLIWKKNGYRPYFSVKVKCKQDQLADGLKLMREVLFTSNLTDTKRLKEVISEVVLRMENRIPASGHIYAANRALSYVDPQARYKERAEGLDYFDFLKNLDKNFVSQQDTLVRQLRRTLHGIFRKENLTVSLTGEYDFDRLLAGEFESLGEALFHEPIVKAVPQMTLEKQNEGIKTSSQVQYDAAAGCFESDERPYTGALNVLKTIFSYGYLWENVRVLGGAYGCMCGFTRNGYGYFTSYRDPNLKETYEVYKKAADYVRDFSVDDRDMRKYIIGTLSSMDIPMESSDLGNRSFQAYQSGITVEMIQKERDQIFECTQETIRGLASYIEAMMQENAICAIGNDKTIEEAAGEGVFDHVRSLS